MRDGVPAPPLASFGFEGFVAFGVGATFATATGAGFTS
jgi:hypothetical protein